MHPEVITSFRRARSTVADKIPPDSQLFERVLNAPEWFDAVLDVVTDEAAIGEALRRSEDSEFLAALEVVMEQDGDKGDSVRLWVLLRLVDGYEELAENPVLLAAADDSLKRLKRGSSGAPGTRHLLHQSRLAMAKRWKAQLEGGAPVRADPDARTQDAPITEEDKALLRRCGYDVLDETAEVTEAGKVIGSPYAWCRSAYGNRMVDPAAELEFVRAIGEDKARVLDLLTRQRGINYGRGLAARWHKQIIGAAPALLDTPEEL